MNTKTFVGVMAGITAMVAVGAVDPIDLTTAQRFAWQQGFAQKVELQILPDGLGSIAIDAVTPEGGVVSLEGGKLYLTWTPQELGLHEVVIQVTASNPPPFANWTGQLIVNTQTVKIQVWVYPEGDALFISTGPDTLIRPLLPPQG